MMRVLIADDEAPARERLRQMLLAHPNIEVVGEAGTGAEAMSLVASLNPGLLFLDIQMPEGTGLDVAACLPAPRPAIIFCTAFDQHAIEAFELSAADYLLKPVSRLRLAQAITKVSSAPASDRAIDNLGHTRDLRLLVRSGSHYTVVPTAKVAYFEAADGLTRLVTDSGQEHWMDPPLQELEDRLDSKKFYRISRGAIVALSAVLEVHPLPGGAAVLALRNGDRLEVSRRRMKDLLRALGG